MSQALYQAFLGFWNPTPELRAAGDLPLRARLKAEWTAFWHWPVLWRRAVVVFVAMQLWNIGYLAVRGFEADALERQRHAAAAAATTGIDLKFDYLPDDRAPDWARLSYADAAGMTDTERARRIAQYCKWQSPQEMNDAEFLLSTTEEFRTLKRFKCWK